MDGELYQRQKICIPKNPTWWKLHSIEFLACGRISMRHAYSFVITANELSVEECTDRTGRVAHYGVGNDRPDSSFKILRKGVPSPKSKVTVRQVALLANLRIHTAAVNAAPVVCSDRI
jgi:hypothetical protein